MRYTTFKHLRAMADSRLLRRLQAGAAALMFTAYSPAFADGGISGAMDKAKTMINEGVSGLTALGLVIVTAAILFVGFRMIFRSAQWADLAPVFWGGLLVGSAATIAGAFM